MSAQHSLAFETAHPDLADDAPRITAEDEAAFAAWCTAHPASPQSVPGQDHARWMLFSAARRLVAMRAAASGGAPPRDFDPDGA